VPSKSTKLFGDAGADFLTAPITKDGYKHELYGGSGSDVFVLSGDDNISLFNKNNTSTVVEFFQDRLPQALPVAGVSIVSALMGSVTPWFGPLLGLFGGFINGMIKSLSPSAPPAIANNDDLVWINDFTLGEDIIMLPKLENADFNIKAPTNDTFLIEARNVSTGEFSNIARVQLSNPLIKQDIFKTSDLENYLKKTFDVKPGNVSESDYCLGDKYIFDNSSVASGNSIISHNSHDYIIGGSGNDTIQANGGDDTLNGNNGDDVLYGNSGSDILIGGAGNDTLNGGESVDTADYSTSTNKVIVTLNNGWITDPNDPINSRFNDGYGSKDKLYNVENLTGSKYDDELNGEWYAWDNIINGLAGNDTISGNGGNDTLIGGAGNDQLIGGTGDDIIDGGNGSDLIVINGYRWEFELKWSLGNSGKFTIKDNVFNRDGIDSLLNVERLQFKEVNVALFNNNMWFNPASYLSQNADLAAAFGTDYSAAATHYIRDGYRENRRGVFG